MSQNHNRFSLLDSVGEFFDLDYRPPKKQRTETRLRTMETSGIEQQKYLIMSHQEEGKMLSKITPFGVQKGLDCITTAIEDVQKLRSGDLLILAKSKTAAESLKKATTLGGLAKIKVTEHPYLNNSKGIVFSYDLLDLSEAEITQGLQNQNVIETRRIKKWSDGKLVDTPALVLTFANVKVPETIKAGYIWLKVKLYIPNPLRCTMCQKFGHPKKRCNGTPTCPKCSKHIPLGHESIVCDAIKCVNCEEEHFAYSRDCAVYKKEAEIVKIKTVDRISHKDAKDKYYRLHANTTGAKPDNNKSFAEVIKHKKASVQPKQSTQAMSTAPCVDIMDTSESSNRPETSVLPLTTKKPSHTENNNLINTEQIPTNITPHTQNNYTSSSLLFHPIQICANEPTSSSSNINYTNNKKINYTQKIKRTTSKEKVYDQHRPKDCVEYQPNQPSTHSTIHPRAKLSAAEEAILNSNERQG